jgi:hypothetical protein
MPRRDPNRIAQGAFFAAIASGFLPLAVRLRTLAREQARRREA